MRDKVPLESHAAVPGRAERGDTVSILMAQDAQRLQELVPIRHGRMSATPFTFYRGGAAIMAADLARTPSTDISVQLCGDAHLSNFGLFNGPDRRLVFDLNDFDETHPGPFEWDVKRLAASVAVAGRNNELSANKIDRAVRASVEGYRTTVSELSRLAPLAVHYRRLELDEVKGLATDVEQRKEVESVSAKAAGKDHLRALDKLTTVEDDGRRVIVPDPPVVTRLDKQLMEEQTPTIIEFFDLYLQTLPAYRRRLFDRYTVVDLARKVVGVGSVGTRCFIVLLESGDGEPLFMQLKEATASVLEAHLGASQFEPGERVVVGQRLMQTMGDILLGWARYEDRATGETNFFYFRQLWDGKGSLEVDGMGANGLRRYGWLCGSALALAHARAGDATMIAGYLGKTDTFDQAIAEFSSSYADLNELDHAAHQAAIAGGSIVIQRDV
ncbi:MAG: DUF2252 domain-containing protein [Acidimicrobiia bacterium]|nr:DUF2252 domain-containing protein [Acidimicrobiia bacterium]MDH4306087.1 DUF2252 domain-containing protein [Acidimicrobiia bacterium]